MSEKLNKRNPVFQADELSLLDSLLYKYRNVLENKHKGAVQVAPGLLIGIWVQSIAMVTPGNRATS